MKYPFFYFFITSWLWLSCEPRSKAGVSTMPPSDFNVYFARFSVSDYKKWKDEYDKNDSLRSIYGIKHFKAATFLDDTARILLIDFFTDAEKARSFVASPGLKEAMRTSGVQGFPSFNFMHSFRDEDAPTSVKDRLYVKVRVKNFDLWLKAYDEYGMAKRKEKGLIDRGLGRDMDDPETVFAVFAVPDWPVVNAYLHSDEWQQFLVESGVEGAPEVVKYRFRD